MLRVEYKVPSGKTPVSEFGDLWFVILWQSVQTPLVRVLLFKSLGG